MKNYVLLTKDESCFGFSRFFKRNLGAMYEYPVAYEDGLTSRLKSATNGRKAWGIVFKNYIISIHPAEKEMTISQIEDYCWKHSFAGLPYCVANGRVMKKLMRKLPTINSIIKELGGTPFEAKWHIAKNNECGDLTGFSPKYYGVHPRVTSYYRCYWEIPEDMKTTFYPAIQL